MKQKCLAEELSFFNKIKMRRLKDLLLPKVKALVC